MSDAEVFVICDLSSLQAWQRHLLAQGRRRVAAPEILLQLKELSSEQNQKLTTLLNQYQRECGCTLGSYFSMAAALIMLAFYAFGRGSGSCLSHMAVFACVTLAAGLVGKLLGLAWAKWRVINISRRMCNLVIRQQEEKANAAYCRDAPWGVSGSGRTARAGERSRGTSLFAARPRRLGDAPRGVSTVGGPDFSRIRCAEDVYKRVPTAPGRDESRPYTWRDPRSLLRSEIPPERSAFPLGTLGSPTLE